MSFYDLERKIQKKIIRYCSDTSVQENKILIAYSGGADSSVLLSIVNKLSAKMNFKYDFVYINHYMNQNTNHIINFGREFAHANETNFIYHDIKEKPLSNKELFFRKYRYKYLNDLKKKAQYSFIFTAHHYNDQIETLYMRTRGKYNWTNLLGVQEYRGYVRRPLLQIKKKDIFSYAIKHGIPWFFDNTNNDNIFFRNKIRNTVLINKSSFYYMFLSLLNKYSKINFYFFNKQLEKNKRKIIISESPFIVLNKLNFLNLSDNYKKIFFQLILKKYNNGNLLMNKNTKWSALWSYISKNKNLKDFTLSKEIFVNNSKDLIIIRNFKKYQKKIDLVDEAIWNKYIFKIEEKDFVAGKQGLNCIYINKNLLSEGLFVRNWNIGDFYIDRSNKKKKVSKLFLKNKFNNYKKMVHPLIVNSNDEILWIPELTNEFNLNNPNSKNNCIKISKEILN